MEKKKTVPLSFLTGTFAGTLGGLIGLGGAEFRLPFLVGLFKYSAKKAIAINTAISLITVLSSLIFRTRIFDFSALTPLLSVIISIVVGSMTGAFFGVDLSKKITETALKKVILALLIFIGCLLIFESFVPLISGGIAFWNVYIEIAVGIVCGLVIGLISSLLGVAGGEIIIPVLILIFGVDVKIAGVASMLISLPTILIGLSKHTANKMYSDKSDFPSLVIPMGVGAVAGAFIGTALVAYVPSEAIKLLLGVLLIFSALKLFLEKGKPSKQKG